MNKLLAKKIIMSVFAGAVLFSSSSVWAADIILKPAGSDVGKFEGSYEELKDCTDWSYNVWEDIYIVYHKDCYTNNELTFGASLHDTVMKAEIYGGNTGVGDVEGNKVTVNGGYFEYSIYGGATYEGNASNNIITVNNGSVDTVCGGGASYGEAKNNAVNVNGGYVEYVCGGYGFVGASNNVINMTDGIVEIIEGGESENLASHNTVNISGGQARAVVGGYSRDTASYNIVNISGGTFTGDVYGGFSRHGNANDNIVNIGGNANLKEAILYGSNVVGATGNILNISEGWNGSVKAIENFNEINVGKGTVVTVVDNLTLANKAVLNIADGSSYTDKYAVNGNVNVETDAKVNLQIENIDVKEATYNIATQYTGALDAWTLDNYLMEAEKWTNENGLQVSVRVKDAGKIAEDIGLSQETASMIANVITKNKSDNPSSADVAVGNFVENVINNSTSKEVVQEAFNAAEKMAEAGGVSATAVNIVNNVTATSNQRLSLGGNVSGGGSKGGRGVGLLEDGGSAIWAQYVHGKDTVEDMPSTAGASSYTGQFNGIVMGVDFKKVGKFQSGVAFNYGEGDTNSFGSSALTRSDYDFWGVGYYGNIRNENFNFIFDINYGQTESDITQSSSGGLSEADTKTTTWSTGVRAEKLYQNDAVQIVPYAGLRYMTIDTDDYENVSVGARYKVDRQNIWLLPLGVSIKEEIVNANGWVVTPKVDLSYIWAFGDTDSSMDVVFGSTEGSKVGYTVMDDGSFLGLVGVEATMEDWSFGVSYSYQKGDHSESKKWFVDAKYSF